MIIWIRYRHIKAHYADSPARVQLLNIASFIFGFLSMIGLIMVGSFQVSDGQLDRIAGTFSLGSNFMPINYVS